MREKERVPIPIYGREILRQDCMGAYHMWKATAIPPM